MVRVYTFEQLLMRCINAINDGIVSFDPPLMAHLYIYLHDHQYIQNLILTCKRILFIFVLVLVIIVSISHGYIRGKHTYVQDLPSTLHKNEFINVIEQEKLELIFAVPQVCEISTENQIIDCDKLSSEESSNKYSVDEKVVTRLSKQLICYCDGSYSGKTRIGYSGFRASNGYSEYRRCALRRPCSGSTESEVFAACLALQYIAKYQYDTLILYTDNLKVEQLLLRPKMKDYEDYPTFFGAFAQCYEGNDHFDIQVERVCGHPTWYEQRECVIKREFAKVDRQVRRKRQQHEYKYYFTAKTSNPFHMTYSYQYSERYSTYSS